MVYFLSSFKISGQTDKMPRNESIWTDIFLVNSIFTQYRHTWIWKTTSNFWMLWSLLFLNVLKPIIKICLPPIIVPGIPPGLARGDFTFFSRIILGIDITHWMTERNTTIYSFFDFWFVLIGHGNSYWCEILFRPNMCSFQEIYEMY